jgi:hypothetical protein
MLEIFYELLGYCSGDKLR